MALKQLYTADTGSVHADAYHVISLIKQNPMQKRTVVCFAIYATESARDDYKTPVEQVSYVLTGELYETVVAPAANVQSGENVSKSIYEYIKTMPEYDGAEDC